MAAWTGITAAKNIDVTSINTAIMEKIPGDVKEYKSIDSVTEDDDVVNYPVEFLNSLDLLDCHHMHYAWKLAYLLF